MGSAPIYVRIPDTFPFIEADPERLSQVVRNLVANALRYTPANGEIGIAARETENGVEVLVKDTGSGIASNHLPHIFDRFYRADPARARATGGAGLGLAIVKHLVELHGGHITVASEVGEGTTFAVRLPLRLEKEDCL
jgi:signal transduction histidine kinase